MLEQAADALVVVPVVLADQHHRQAVGARACRSPPAASGPRCRGFPARDTRSRRRSGPRRAPAAAASTPRDGPRLRRRRARSRPLGSSRSKPGVRARAGVEQRRRRPHERLRARGVEPQVPREAEVRERVPRAGTALADGAAGVCGRNRRTPASSPRMAATPMLAAASPGGPPGWPAARSSVPVAWPLASGTHAASTKSRSARGFGHFEFGRLARRCPHSLLHATYSLLTHGARAAFSNGRVRIKETP